MWFADPEAWAALVTLTVLEIVLGIDNLVFISIVASRVPKEQQHRARQVGIALALVSRLLLLFTIVWAAQLTQPVFELMGRGVSWRDIVLFAGGLFLLYKGTVEIHASVEGEEEGPVRAPARFAPAVFQIAVMDIVFSIDSVITAVGMAQQLSIMVTAVVIAVLVMLFAAGPVGGFVDRHPTVKMLALSFLLLIGIALVADGLQFHIPRGYLYFAVGFSILVESLNLWAARRRRARARSG